MNLIRLSLLILALSQLFQPTSSWALGRFYLGVGAFTNPTPALIGVGVGYELVPNLTFRVGSDIKALMQACQSYGASLKYLFLTKTARFRPFLSAGTDYYKCPIMTSGRFYGAFAGGVDWNFSSALFAHGHVTAVTSGTRFAGVVPGVGLGLHF